MYLHLFQRRLSFEFVSQFTVTLLFCAPGHAQSRSMNDIADTPSTDQVIHLSPPLHVSLHTSHITDAGQSVKQALKSTFPWSDWFYIFEFFAPGNVQKWPNCFPSAVRLPPARPSEALCCGELMFFFPAEWRVRHQSFHFGGEAKVTAGDRGSVRTHNSPTVLRPTQ